MNRKERLALAYDRMCARMDAARFDRDTEWEEGGGRGVYQRCQDRMDAARREYDAECDRINAGTPWAAK